MAKEKVPRTRNWTSIFYPESAPKNWDEIIESWHCQAFVSPLHDEDENKAEPVDSPDRIKKAHYHLVLMFEGLKSEQQIKDIIAPLNGTYPQPVQSIRSMARYLVHMDNPEKHQYKKSDIKCYGGADWSAYCQATATVEKQMRSDILDLIREENIREFSDLIDTLAMEPYISLHPEWLDFVADQKTMFFSAYIRSRKYKAIDRFRYAEQQRAALALEACQKNMDRLGQDRSGKVIDVPLGDETYTFDAITGEQVLDE